jgi:hypothetical protein
MISAQKGHFLLSPVEILSSLSFFSSVFAIKAAITPTKGLKTSDKKKKPTDDLPLFSAITPATILRAIQVIIIAIPMLLSLD